VDKLGGKSWETAKKKAKESAQKIAEELLNLYALRQVKEGHRFSPTDSFYKQFEATFAYDETPDQRRAIEDVLPDYEKSIRRAAAANGLPWELLAALSWQESHWNPKAASPTGVRGFMMLTLPTAKELGVEDRLNPLESLKGGAKYLANMKERLPDDIKEPNRTWMALAAYNMGFGHLLDARVLAARRGLDANSWTDIRQVLPLLQKPAIYNSLRHGRGRGVQALHFVQQIRTYMYILRQFSA
jgi:membrane-bound lytic murein transglycosylase F